MENLFCAVYNLVEGEDVEAIEARIAAYQRENYESIIQNDARKVKPLS